MERSDGSPYRCRECLLRLVGTISPALVYLLSYCGRSGPDEDPLVLEAGVRSVEGLREAEPEEERLRDRRDWDRSRGGLLGCDLFGHLEGDVPLLLDVLGECAVLLVHSPTNKPSSQLPLHLLRHLGTQLGGDSDEVASRDGAGLG